MVVKLGGRGPGHIARVQGVGNPASIFGTNLKVWFDVQDLSTMWQDTGATTPAAVGQVVRRIYCKANPAFYAQQSNATQEPVLRQTAGGIYYLETDGSNDGMVTPSLDLSATNKIGLFTGARKLSDTAFQAIIEFSADSNSNNGSFVIGASALTGDASRRTWVSSLSGSTNNIAGCAIYSQPTTAVISAIYDLSQSTAALEQVVRINGAAVTPTFSNTSSGTGNFGNYALYLLRRGGTSSPFKGYFYGCALCDTTPTAGQISSIETYYNLLAGAY